MDVNIKPVDFSDSAMLAEPHAYLAALREKSPVALASGPNGREFYVVTKGALIEEVTRRTEEFSNNIGHLLFAGGVSSPEVAELLSKPAMATGGLLVHDDPEHARMRALVNAVFAQGRIANMAPIIDRIADELIDDFIEAGECDFVNQFAVLLPTYLIADILGLPRSQYDKVRYWSDAVIRIVSRMGNLEEEIANAKLVSEFRRFIIDTTAARRKVPADDLISNLVHVRVEGYEPMTDVEIAPLVFEIAVAGNETTRNTLMSGIVRLINHPDQLQAMKNDAGLAPNAVEELLRYETPATSMWRVAARDAELGGVTIPAGAEILLRFDAGNFDPARFEDPLKFDITRKNARQHMAFGAPGIHRCLGQMLARKEMVIAFPKLLTRLNNLRVVADGSDTSYWPGLLHRGIGAVRLAFDPGKRVRTRQEAA